jgi:hypothetical protein
MTEAERIADEFARAHAGPTKQKRPAGVGGPFCWRRWQIAP